MSDTQAAMREFRFLDDKRRAAGLSATEEQRWAELRQALGIEDASAQDAYAQQQGYYAEDGNWYPYPAGYDPNAYYDPNQYPQGYAEGQQGYDPNQAYYAQQGYDPNAASPEGYDPNQAAYYPQGYDPNQQAYDPNAAGYDPNGQYAADPNAAWADQQQQSAASLLSLGPEDGLEVPPPAESSWVPPSPVAAPAAAPEPVAPVASHEEDGPPEVDASEVMEVLAEDVTPIEGDAEHHAHAESGTVETPALEFNSPVPQAPAAEAPTEAPLEFSDDAKLPLPAQDKSPWFNLPAAAAEAEPEAVTSSMIATPSMSMSLAEPAAAISSNIEPAAPTSSPTIELSPDLEASRVELASASEFVQYQRSDERSIDLADSGSPSDPTPLELEAEPSAQAVAEASERVPLASAADFLDMPELTSTGHQGAPEPAPAAKAPENPPASSPPPPEEPAEWEQPRPPTPTTAIPSASGLNPLDSHLPGFDISAPATPAEIPPAMLPLAGLTKAPSVAAAVTLPAPAAVSAPVPPKPAVTIPSPLIPLPRANAPAAAATSPRPAPAVTITTTPLVPLSAPIAPPPASVPTPIVAAPAPLPTATRTPTPTPVPAPAPVAVRPATPALVPAAVPPPRLSPAPPAPAPAPAPALRAVEIDLDVDSESESESDMQEIELTEEVIEPPPPPARAAAPVVAAPSVVPGPPVPQAKPQPVNIMPAASASAVAKVPAGASTRQAADQLFDRSGRSLSGTATVGAAFIEGEHRVIVHTVEGQVKRGVVRDVDLLDTVIPLELQSGTERIPAGRVKAIFFMTGAGAKQPAPSGQKIRVTFGDGRQIAGFSTDFRGTEAGFFLVPADNRTNTARIYVFRSSVQSVTAA